MSSDDGFDVIGSPPRGPKRQTMRKDDSLSRAKQRAEALREHLGDVVDGSDEFYIPKDDIPDGWDYEWKRKYLINKEEHVYQVALARSGWEPVPAERHPSYMPAGGNYTTIERKGMILMERPTEISDEIRRADLRRDRFQVRQREEQLKDTGSGQFERNNNGENLVKIKKSYGAIPVPD